MKTILRGAVAALALAATAGVANAQTSEFHYAGIPFVGTITGNTPSGAGELSLAFGIGTRYSAAAAALGNTETATPTVNVAFTLTGKVSKDCSFYAGNTPAARNIDFGVIGVRTGNNENVSSAFDMRAPAAAEIKTLTAGCNFNNTVKLEKDNGNSGLTNDAAGGYDMDEFQANLPYEVKARWTGVAQNAVASGTTQTLTVATNQGLNTKNQGAWRSAMTIDILVPVANKALVAGTYEDTLTLTLSAI